MINSFADKETVKIWEGEKSKDLPTKIQHVARVKLRMINSTENINDLRIPPANLLKKLKGEFAKYYSIRINDQWRIIFNWDGHNAENVEITNYHE